MSYISKFEHFGNRNIGPEQPQRLSGTIDVDTFAAPFGISD